MTEIPNPAQVLAQREAAAERAVERERVKVVRKRRRLQRGGALARAIDPVVSAELAKIVHPDVGEQP